MLLSARPPLAYVPSMGSSPLSVPLFSVPSTSAFLPPLLFVNILLTSSRPSSNFTHSEQPNALHHHPASWTTVYWCFPNDQINFTSHTSVLCYFSGMQRWIMCCDTLIHEPYIKFSWAEWWREKTLELWAGFVLTVSHSTFGITGKLLHLYFSFLICKMGLITVITLRVMVWIKWVRCVQNAQNCVWSSGSAQKLSAPTVSVSDIILSNQLTLKHSFHCEVPTWLCLKLKWFLPGNHCALCSCLFCGIYHIFPSVLVSVTCLLSSPTSLLPRRLIALVFSRGRINAY